MNERLGKLLEGLNGRLEELPGVFSTAQWGGRAYKVGNPKKPKLVAHVVVDRDGRAITVAFKLPKERAEDAVDRHEWVEPSSFGSLGRSGWVSAKLTRKRDLTVLAKLLAESRALYPVTNAPPPTTPAHSGAGAGSNAIARRIDRVMGEIRPDGWEPDAGGFDDG
ncbi:MAG: MmcQ/YjbR family DNA-binding protein [Planctomycetes bacterium]|nr:MmcQ/YjbR family DNA-binding protein [Planctomycetota bacterium]